MENKPKIGFSLHKIIDQQFAIIEESYNENEEVNLSTEINFAFDKENRIVVVFTKFIYLQNNIPFIIIEIGFQFMFDEPTWNNFYNIETKKITIPKQIAQHLSVITIGTARGILHTKTEGSKFNMFLLPSINVTEILKEDVFAMLTE